MCDDLIIVAVLCLFRVWLCHKVECVHTLGSPSYHSQDLYARYSYTVEYRSGGSKHLLNSSHFIFCFTAIVSAIILTFFLVGPKDYLIFSILYHTTKRFVGPVSV